MAMSGADIEALRSLAGRMRDAGTTLGEHRTGLTQSLAYAGWTGRDAEEFRAEWQGRLAPSLAQAAQSLADAAADLERHAREQEDASGVQPGWSGVSGLSPAEAARLLGGGPTGLNPVAFYDLKTGELDLRLFHAADEHNVFEWGTGDQRELGPGTADWHADAKLGASSHAEAGINSEKGLYAQAGVAVGLTASPARAMRWAGPPAGLTSTVLSERKPMPERNSVLKARRWEQRPSRVPRRRRPGVSASAGSRWSARPGLGRGGGRRRRGSDH